MGKRSNRENLDEHSGRFGSIISGENRNIETGFRSVYFGEKVFDGNKDVVSMLSHFVMTEITFAPHLHQNISIFTVLFEDSEGNLLNRDTAGGATALQAGDVYELTSGSSAVHEQRPDDNASIHALQIFCKLSPKSFHKPASATCIRNREIPVIEGNGSRVRVALGVHRIGDDIKIADDKVGLLDVFICAGKAYVHEIARDRKTWIYVVSGHLEAIIGNEHCVIQSGQLTYVSAGPAITLGTTSDVATHCVLISPKPWPNQ